jgi:hypothetical protein
MANFAFFPLFPLASFLASQLLDLSPQTGVLLASKLFFLLSIYAFIKMVQTIAPSSHALVNGSIAAFNPYSIYGNAGYTEPLFLLLTCIFFALLGRSMFLRAGLTGALLSATRLVGVVSIVSYLISLTLPWPTWRWRNRFKGLAGMALIPTGLLLFMAHLQERTGDPPGIHQHPKSLGPSYSNGASQLALRPQQRAIERLVAISLLGDLRNCGNGSEPFLHPAPQARLPCIVQSPQHDHPPQLRLLGAFALHLVAGASAALRRSFLRSQQDPLDRLAFSGHHHECVVLSPLVF